MKAEGPIWKIPLRTDQISTIICFMKVLNVSVSSDSTAIKKIKTVPGLAGLVSEKVSEENIWVQKP